MFNDDLTYFESKEFRELLRRYEKMVAEGRLTYMDADELTDVAEFYMMNGREDDATLCINHAINLHPEAIDPQIFLARKAIFLGDNTKAKRIIDSIYDQSDREVLFVRAELLIRQNREDEAEIMLQKVLDKQENKADFIYDTIGVFGDSFLWKKVETWLKKLQELEPNSHRFKESWAELLVSTGRCKEAIEYINKIIDDDAFNTYMWKLLSEAQSGIEDYEQALDSIDNVLAIDEKDTQAKLIKANCLFHLECLEEAHKMFEAFFKEETMTNSLACYLDGVCLCSLERYEEALSVLKRALNDKSTSPSEQSGILMQLSYVHSKMHHTNQAFACLEQACKLASADMKIETELIKGSIFLDNGNPDEAYKLFAKAVEETSDRRGTLFNLAIILTESFEYANALSIFKMLYETSDEEREMVVPYLAYCYKKLNDKENYEMYLPIAQELNPRLTRSLMRK